MNEGSFDGWLDRTEYNDTIMKAAAKDVDRINLDEQAADILADAAFDAGFAYGVEAQKHGLGDGTPVYHPPSAG